MNNVIYHGDTLKEAILNSSEDRLFQVDSLIPEKSITMFFASDGSGKSLLSLQLCIEASAGKDVFSALEVPKPLKIIYVLAERSVMEPFQRAKVIMNKVNINYDNLVIDDSLQSLDFRAEKDRMRFVNELEIKADKCFGHGNCDLVFIDPIYALCGNLVEESGATALNAVIRATQNTLNCSVAYNHHTNRGMRDTKTGSRIAEDMYGGRFLRANCTGVFHISKNKEGNGTIYTVNKDSYSCLANKLVLDYDPEFMLSYITNTDSLNTRKDKVKLFLKYCYKNNKTFDFDELKAKIGCSRKWVHHLLSSHIDLGEVVCLNPNERKHLYAVKRA